MRIEGLALMSQRVIFVTRLYRFNGFGTRQHIAYVCNAICYHPSAWLPIACSGRHTISQKWLKLGLWNFHHT